MQTALSDYEHEAIQIPTPENKMGFEASKLYHSGHFNVKLSVLKITRISNNVQFLSLAMIQRLLTQFTQTRSRMAMRM